MRISVVVAIVGGLAVLALGLLPASDGSYVCDGPPVARLVSPAAERGGEFFFDEGAACNADARRRGWQMLGVGLVTGAVGGGLAVWERRHPDRLGADRDLPSAA